MRPGCHDQLALVLRTGGQGDSLVLSERMQREGADEQRTAEPISGRDAF